MLDSTMSSVSVHTIAVTDVGVVGGVSSVSLERFLEAVRLFCCGSILPVVLQLVLVG